MRKISKKQAIRNTFVRLGLHARPKEIVQALEQLGVQVDEGFARVVRVGLLKEATGRPVAKASGPVVSPVVRRCPKGFPRRRGQG
jgi:hypothetical protein